jgi:hypothetical protein
LGELFSANSAISVLKSFQFGCADTGITATGIVESLSDDISQAALYYYKT